ncbi:type IV secretion system protein [Phenylobacterium aquaticum]|uniref:type IV secretion system protein n=1 Tax=Phenylobacterium aquaticum TaxID=1763816 RepID=UPI001F5D3E17|nr:type IV secretion system protein [Phenylobacterium aquaticum]MCI3131092.1 type IV secretion system protein [Phenylobacterium aquaticum]
MTACGGLSPDAGLSAGLQVLDCQVNLAVAQGYGRLFAGGGTFSAALTSALTLYVAFLALGLITGRTRLSLPALAPRVLTLGLVLTFATAWPAYHAVIYGLLTGGPDQVAQALMGGRGGATQAFAGRLDILFDGVVQAAQGLGAQAGPNTPQVQTALRLLWLSGLVLLLATAGLLVITHVVLAVLLALGPLFVATGLFDATRGLFQGWLRTSVGFGFAPLLVVVGGAGALDLLNPLVVAIADDPAAAVRDLRPVVTLFLAALIYAGLTLTLAWAAFMLTRDWRPAASREPAPAPPESASAQSSARAEVVSGADARVAELVSGATRDLRITGVARSAAGTSAPAPAAAPGLGGTTLARGLGQTLRTPGRSLSGPLGS